MRMLKMINTYFLVWYQKQIQLTEKLNEDLTPWCCKKVTRGVRLWVVTDKINILLTTKQSACVQSQTPSH